MGNPADAAARETVIAVVEHLLSAGVARWSLTSSPRPPPPLNLHLCQIRNSLAWPTWSLQ